MYAIMFDIDGDFVNQNNLNYTNIHRNIRKFIENSSFI